MAGQRAWPRIGGRREHRPDDHRALHIADIDAELVDRAAIVLRGAAPRSKGAVDRPRGSEDETKAAGYVAVQNTGLHGLRVRRGIQPDGTSRQTEHKDRDREFFGHPINLLLAEFRWIEGAKPRRRVI